MGGKQLGFSDYEQTTAKKQTKREKFLAEMEAVVPWDALIGLIEPIDPKTGKEGGHPPYPLATMLRIHGTTAPAKGAMSATRKMAHRLRRSPRPANWIGEPRQA